MAQRTQIRLTSLAACAGCASKGGPGTLKDVLANLRLAMHPHLPIGLHVAAGAGIES